jgi:hypothetical protein
MALRRAVGIGSAAALRSAAYLRRASPSPARPHPLVPPPPAARTFAAPPQVMKRSTKDDDDDGPRINNDITSPFVRLVTDQGHSVVPRHEALQLAARMDLDLVEVLTALYLLSSCNQTNLNILVFQLPSPCQIHFFVYLSVTLSSFLFTRFKMFMDDTDSGYKQPNRFTCISLYNISDHLPHFLRFAQCSLPFLFYSGPQKIRPSCL